MAKINNKNKYKITPVTAEDLLLGTQLATGKTSNFQVENLVGIVQERIDEDSIQNVEFRGEDLPIIDGTVVLPSKLSQFENDLDPSGEGGKIDNVSFKGEDLPVVDKRVELPSDLSEFTDNSSIIPDTSTFVDETQVQEKIEDWSIKNIETIAKLKQEVGKEGQKVRLLGYYSAGDKPELLYEWKTGLGEDDGGSVINSTGGRWEALFGDSVVNISHYGVTKQNKEIYEKMRIITQKHKGVEFNKQEYTLKSLDQIVINNSFIIKGNKAIIKVNNSNNSNIFTIKHDFEIKDVSFDFQNTGCRSLFFFEKGDKRQVKIENIKIENVKDNRADSYCYLIYLNNNISFNIENIVFKNISKKSLINSDEESGLISCILINSTTEEECEGGIMKDLYFEEIYNTDEEGRKHNWGGSKSIHIFTQGGKSNIIINNIIGKNSGKRTLKIQASDVVVNNMYVNNSEDNINTMSVIGVQSDGSWESSNIVLNNINIKSIADYGVVITAKNVKINNSNIITSSTDRMYSRGINIMKGGECHISNCYIEAPTPIVIETNQGDVDKVHIIDSVFKGIGETTNTGAVFITSSLNTVKELYLNNIKWEHYSNSFSSFIGDLSKGNKDYTYINNIVIYDFLSDSKKASIGSVVNNSSVIIKDIKIINKKGVNEDLTKPYDLLRFTNNKNGKIENINYNNKGNRGVMIYDSQNIELGEVFYNDSEFNVSSIIISNSFNIKINKNNEKYSILTINQNKTEVTRSIGKEDAKPNNVYPSMQFYNTEQEVLQVFNGEKWKNINETQTQYPSNFNTNYSQNAAFGEATLIKKGNEVFYKMFANKTTPVEVGDTVFTLQSELRPKTPEFIVGHGGNGVMVVWLMIEPTTGEVKVQEFPTGEGDSLNAVILSGSYFIKE